MTLSGAHAVPWRAVVQFHCEILRRGAEGFFALPVTASGSEYWSSLSGFEPGRLAGPWQVKFQALDSPHLQREVRAGPIEAFIGGPCWFRWTSDDEQHRHLEWSPLIYRAVTVKAHDERLRIIPTRDE